MLAAHGSSPRICRNTLLLLLSLWSALTASQNLPPYRPILRRNNIKSLMQSRQMQFSPLARPLFSPWTLGSAVQSIRYFGLPSRHLLVLLGDPFKPSSICRREHQCRTGYQGWLSRPHMPSFEKHDEHIEIAIIFEHYCIALGMNIYFGSLI